MSRPIYEPSLQRTDARLGYTSSQLLRRPAPTSAGSPIAIGYYERSLTLTQAAGDLINWSSLNEDMAQSADYFGLTAGSDIQIKLPGVYAFEFLYTQITTTFTSGSLVQYLVNIEVDSGSQGFWSTKTPADEAAVFTAIQVQDATVANVYQEPPPLNGYAVWLSTDTMPVVISTFVQFSEDSVGKQYNTAFRFTWLRLGDADV